MPSEGERAAQPMRMRTLLGYLWAAPATAIGLCAAGVACAFGATARKKDGVLEVAGAPLSSLRVAGSGRFRILAITLGHVVIGADHRVLDDARMHEHAHVRQYERWGLLFFPLYAASSAVQLLRGRHPYWDNAFERQARCAASTISAIGPLQSEQGERARGGASDPR